MAASFKTQDGRTVNDGDTTTLTLVYDGGEHSQRERYAYIEMTGTVRQFEQFERVYDDEGIAICNNCAKELEG